MKSECPGLMAFLADVAQGSVLGPLVLIDYSMMFA